MRNSMRKIAPNDPGDDRSYPSSVCPTTFAKVSAPGTIIESRDIHAHTRVSEIFKVDLIEPYFGDFYT